LLDYWSAISVHPYRKMEPETVVDDYARLRKLIDRYAPAGKRVPIISSEWGYSAASFNVGEAKQSALLARQLLINHSQGIALSIWYDWQDDGRNPREIEHHFGTVRPSYYGSRDPVYDPKPAFRAAQTLSNFLVGYRFTDRISLARDDYALTFQSNGDTRIAAWTTSWFDHAVTIPVGPGLYRITSHTGESVSRESVGKSGLVVNLTGAPQYIALEKP
jgi:hypothetical protein